MNLKQRISLAWRILRQPIGNLYSHGEAELGPNMDIELREMLLVFSSQGHSGMSAAITADWLGKLLRYEPIGPLTGEDGEWVDVGDGVFQNRRCGHVFKQSDRFGGQAYDIDGIVWQDGDGCGFTNAASRVPIVFPYTPKTEYRPAEQLEEAGAAA